MISTLNGWPVKLVDKFTYLGSNVSSTESNVNICLVKAYTAINRLSIIWKSDVSNKIKQDFFQAVALSMLLCMHHIDTYKTHGGKSRWDLPKNATCCFEQILEATPHKTAVAWPLTSNLKNHPCKMNKTCRTLPVKEGQTHDILLWTPAHGCTNVSQQTRKNLHQLCADTGYSLRTCQEQWMIGTDGERVWEIHAISTTWWWKVIE